MSGTISYGNFRVPYGMTKFTNPISGETLIHRDLPNGKRDLIIEKPGATGLNHFHAVLEKNGKVSYLRDYYRRLIADDKK